MKLYTLDINDIAFQILLRLLEQEDYHKHISLKPNQTTLVKVSFELAKQFIKESENAKV